MITSPSSLLFCPLCGSGDNLLFHQDKFRQYFQCANCALCFVPEHFHLSESAERAEYDKHQNSPLDLGYRQFLSRLIEPLCNYLPQGASGLDFGCGPGPTLSVIIAQKGYSMAVYDKFYATDTAVLSQVYDFVTATEVVEHLRAPNQTLAQIWRCVSLGGYLGIMTKLVIDQQAFAGWHYKNDRTHIAFFSKTTLLWLANHWQGQLVYQHKDVAIFKKVVSLNSAG